MLHSLHEFEANSFSISMSEHTKTQGSGCLKQGNSEELPLTKKATLKSYFDKKRQLTRVTFKRQKAKLTNS